MLFSCRKGEVASADLPSQHSKQRGVPGTDDSEFDSSFEIEIEFAKPCSLRTRASVSDP